MQSKPTLHDEASRLASLHALQVLNTPPEPAFDALVATAAAICHVPVALISLVDEDRQWFKANLGLKGIKETRREAAFCATTVAQRALLEIEDASVHPDFAGNPLVTGHPHIRFYAGAPICLSDGAVVGALCVIDMQPRRLDAQQREVLNHLATAAAQGLDGRRAESQAQAAVAALRLSEARYRTLSEHAPVGVFQTSAKGDCVYTNLRWQQIFGLSLEASLGQGWARSIHPLDRHAVHLEWTLATQDGREFDREFRILRPDQETRYVRSKANPVRDAAGCITGYVGSVEDVTRARQLEAFLDRTGRLGGVGGWQLDLRTRTVVWSEQTKRIHDVPPDYEPVLDKAIEFYTPASRPVVEAAIQAGIEQGRPWDFELPMITATGRSIWVRAIGEAEFEDGKAVRLIGAVKDVTAAHCRNQELQQEQALRLQVESQAAETARLLVERSQMLDVLAHEVRQPLNNASAALQSAAAALASVQDATVGPRLSRAQNVLALVLGGIDNTLAVASLLARPDPIEREDGDIDALLSVAIDDLPHPDRARVHVRRSTTLRTASMDMSLMRLALRNLLANAMRHTRPGTKVTVALADSDEPLALLIDVIDEGPGIPAHGLPGLFQRRAHRDAVRQGTAAGGRDRSAQGLGLGLYIVRRVMELHGGSVQLLRNTPQGITMRLVLVQPLGD